MWPCRGSPDSPRFEARAVNAGDEVVFPSALKKILNTISHIHLGFDRRGMDAWA
jgi:hypothetical protein